MKCNSKILSLMTTLIFAFSLVLVSATATYAVGTESDGGSTSATVNGAETAGNSQMSTTNQGSTGSNGDAGSTAINGKLTEINNVLFTAACIICVIKAVQIGIMFMLNGAGSKGQAKSAILPWIIGAVVCGGYSAIANSVTGLIEGYGEGGVLEPGDPTKVVKGLGGTILSIVMYVAYATAFGVILVIGIKYMTGAAGDKAKVKSTFVPYLIGAIIVGVASNLAIYFMSLGAMVKD